MTSGMIGVGIKYFDILNLELILTKTELLAEKQITNVKFKWSVFYTELTKLVSVLIKWNFEKFYIFFIITLTTTGGYVHHLTCQKILSVKSDMDLDQDILEPSDVLSHQNCFY